MQAMANIFLKVYLGCSFLNTKNQAKQITKELKNEKLHNYEHICRLCSLIKQYDKD